MNPTTPSRPKSSAKRFILPSMWNGSIASRRCGLLSTLPSAVTPCAFGNQRHCGHTGTCSLPGPVAIDPEWKCGRVGKVRKKRRYLADVVVVRTVEACDSTSTVRFVLSDSADHSNNNAALTFVPHLFVRWRWVARGDWRWARASRGGVPPNSLILTGANLLAAFCEKLNGTHPSQAHCG